MPRNSPRKAARRRKSHRPAFRVRNAPRTTDFAARVQAALDRGQPDAVPDEVLQKVLAAAVRLYAAKVERRGNTIEPFAGAEITATETVVAACAMIRAADLNMFDVAMWFHRPA